MLAIIQNEIGIISGYAWNISVAHSTQIHVNPFPQPGDKVIGAQGM